MTVEYCSLNSIKSDEKIFATASHFKKLLLVEYRSSWNEKPLSKNKISNEVNNFLKQFNDPGNLSRVWFIKNQAKQNGDINVFAVNNLETNPFINQFVFSNHEELCTYSEKELFSYSEKNKFPGSIYLVCTNGRKDKCCSKFGLPVFKQLLSLSPNVWECTHVGGDRFAPNIIHLPYCHYYGQLQLHDLNDFHEQTTSRKIFMKNFRGRSLYNWKSQASDFFLRQEYNDADFDSITMHSLIDEGDNYFTGVHLYKKLNRIFSVTVQYLLSAEKYALTCQAKTKHSKPFFKLIAIKEIVS